MAIESQNVIKMRDKPHLINKGMAVLIEYMVAKEVVGSGEVIGGFIDSKLRAIFGTIRIIIC